ncbi:MAG: DUF1538 family protein, partial [Brevundimonas sp.]|nr:DUF1538 family protein [Brevundimonas sp.]
MSVMVPFRAILAAVWTTFRDMLPIILTMGIFEIAVLRRLPPDPASLLFGLLALILGLTLILRGLEMSLFPIGEALSDALAQPGRIAWLMAFAFAIGFGSTVADPSLAAVAAKAAAALVESPEVPATGVDEAT